MLYNKLKNNNKIPFHMPGHKRNTELLGNELPYNIDITEIDGFDNLHNPQGIIKELQEKIQKLYQCERSYPLVNGTTCGILAGIYATVNNGETVLIQRNCHKSVYNGIKFAGAKIEYLEPSFNKYGIADKISPEDVKAKLERHNIKLIVITSPSYEGIISDVEKICDIAHSRGMAVLVDSAHGAHYFEKTSADITIKSLHKTLPALTQCAVANLNGNIVDYKKFENALSIFETSSPSYVLLSSIEKCIDFALNNQSLFKEYNEKMQYFYSQLSKLKYLKALHFDDLGKIVIYSGEANISALNLSNILREKYNIEVEMVSRDYILAMSTVCDTKENLEILIKSLIEIDSTLSASQNNSITKLSLPEKAIELIDVVQKGDLVPLESCVGKISAEFIWAYPPGAPILVPGEIISEDIILYIKDFVNQGIEMYSTNNQLNIGIYCL